MTNETKTKAYAELKNEILRQLKANEKDISSTQKLVYELKNNIHKMKNELAEKINLVLA